MAKKDKQGKQRPWYEGRVPYDRRQQPEAFITSVLGRTCKERELLQVFSRRNNNGIYYLVEIDE